jgi:hypothetical protein
MFHGTVNFDGQVANNLIKKKENKTNLDEYYRTCDNEQIRMYIESKVKSKELDSLLNSNNSSQQLAELSHEEKQTIFNI